MSTYRSQDEAGLPPGQLDDGDDRSADWQDYLAMGIGWGLLLGLALIDYCEQFIGACHG